MTEPNDTPDAPPADASNHAARRPGERLAKAIARAGLGSRREAEGWIGEGRVAVNGVKAETAALNVLPNDRVEVDGRALPARERTRLWLYHKPRGYVTTTHDPEGRETVFSILPPEMPRVISIGRLDINTEGLLLLTNDGGLARVLELPETGWLRRYRVRAFGRADPQAVATLKDGVTIDGFAYGAIEAEIERQQNDNVWLKFGLREGKNREVKRVAEHLGLSVNRLIRISFGPFQLGSLPEGGVEEVRSRTLRDQLGKRLEQEAGCDFEAAAVDFGQDAPRVTGGRGAGRAPGAKPSAAPPAARNRLADPSERVGRRAPVARPRDVAAPATLSEAAERPARKSRAAPIADRKGRTVKVERVERDHADAAPKRVRKPTAGAAERFGASGRPARPPRFGARPEGRDGHPPRRDGPPLGDRPVRLEAGEGFRSRSGERRPAREDGRPPREDRGPPRGPRADDGRGGLARPKPRGPDDARPANRGRDEARPQRRERPQSPRAPRDGGYKPRDGGRERRPEGRTDVPREDRPRPAAARSSAPRWRDDAHGRDSDAAARPHRPAGERPPRQDRSERDGPRGSRPPRGDRPTRARDESGETRAPRAPRPDRPTGERPARDRPERRDRPARPRADRPTGERKPGGAPRGFGGKPGGKPGAFKPRGPGGGKPGGKPGGGRGRPGGADRRR